MVRASLKAEFFVRRDGVCLPKASPLKDREKRTIYDRDEGICQQCGKETKYGGGYRTPFSDGLDPCQVDHIIPRCRGGQNDQDNLQVLCQPCNSQKGNKTPEEYEIYIEEVRKFWERQRGAA